MTTLLQSHHFAAQDGIHEDKNTLGAVPRKRKAKLGKKSDIEGVEESAACPRHSPGKLVQPRKKRKTERMSVQAAYDEPAEEKSVFFRPAESPPRKCQPDLDEVSTYAVPDATTPSGRSDSIFAESKFQQKDGGTNRLNANQSVINRTKKPRRRLPKEKDAQNVFIKTVQPKRTRKRTTKSITKSASFILNSDEPDQEAGVVEPPAKQHAGQTQEGAAESDSVHLGSAEKSTYFGLSSKQKAPIEPLHMHSQLTPTLDAVDVDAEPALAQATTSKQVTVANETAPAPKRRLSWTPVRDTSAYSTKAITSMSSNILQDDSEATVVKPSQDECGTPKQDFGGLIGGFMHRPVMSFNGNAQLPAPKLEITNLAPVTKVRTKKSRAKKGKDDARNISHAGIGEPNEANPKRKRAVKPRRPKEKMTKEKVPKAAKEKKEKKKAQTITALATAGFVRPQQIAPDVGHVDSQRIVSDVAIDARNTATTSNEHNQGSLKTVANNPVVPADASMKTSGVDADNALTANPTKLKARPKKTSKTRSKQSAPVHPGHGLRDPAIVKEDMAKQDFLFGTSSQLRLEESPDFIRDLQTVVEESETITHPTEKGIADSETFSTFQPTAQPHIHGESPSKARSRGSATRVPSAPHGTHLSVQQADRELWSASARDFRGEFMVGTYPRPRMSNASTASGKDDRHLPALTAQGRNDDAVALLNDDLLVPGEPATIMNESKMPTDNVDTDIDGIPETLTLNEDTTSVRHEVALEDDSWMLLRSDESIAVPVQSQTDQDDQDAMAKDEMSASEPARHHHATAPRSKFRLHSLSRSPLRPLDHNIPLPPVFGTEKPMITAAVQAFTSSAVDRAKPRESESSPPKRRPGRPKKNADIASTSPVIALNTKMPAAAKKRGRPPKVQSSALLQNVVESSPSSSRWLDVDDISDSDTPVTPSPPRRKKKAIDSAPLPTLQLSPSAAQVTPDVHHDEQLTLVVEEVTASSSGYPLTNADPQWLGMRADVFGNITKTIKKSKVPSGSSSEGAATWYQKVLLYDPIVVEDLTSWLNAEGLRVDVRKAKPKPKAKGKKPREEPEHEAEVEVVREPLQSWMVQKWCQENSVCCYAQEGSWRGGRNKNY